MRFHLRKIPLLMLCLIGLCTVQAVCGQSTGFKGAPVISGPEEDIAAIKTTLTDLYNALANRDANAYAAVTAPGYYVLEQGEYWDLDYTLHLIGQGKPEGYTRKDRLEYKIIEVYGDAAFVVWDLFAEVTRDGKVNDYQWLESGTLKKIEGEWKMQVLHSTRVEKKE